MIRALAITGYTALVLGLGYLAHLYYLRALAAEKHRDKGWETNDATTSLLLEARAKGSRARQERDALAHELRVVRAERDDHDRWHVCLPELAGIRETEGYRQPAAEEPPLSVLARTTAEVIQFPAVRG